MTTTRHIFTKKRLEGKSRVEKQSEIAIQVEYHLNHVCATKISKVTDCLPQLMTSASTIPSGGLSTLVPCTLSHQWVSPTDWIQSNRLNYVGPSRQYFGMIRWGSLVGQDSLR